MLKESDFMTSSGGHGTKLKKKLDKVDISSKRRKRKKRKGGR